MCRCLKGLVNGHDKISISWHLRKGDRSREITFTANHCMPHASVCAVTQPCPTLCDPMDYCPPGFSSLGFSRQGDWSGLPFPPPGDLLHPTIEPASPVSPALQADSLPPSCRRSLATCYTCGFI